MPENEDLQPPASVEDVSSKLRGGIETCRSVVANYRSLLSNAPGVSGTDTTAADTPASAKGDSI